MASDDGKSAGGFAAIRATLHHLRRETGLIRGGRALLAVNQDGGFDCPGCAWPEPAERSAFEFCENGAKAVAEEATRKRVTAELLASRPIEEWRQLSDFELGQLGRITEPVVREAGSDRYQAISWERAFQLAAGALRRQPNPGRASFYTSGRTSNEAAFLYQLLARAYGTNNLPDCSNMCHESSGVGLSEVIGIGKGTVSLEDFDHADLILVIGQNPGTNHPRMLTTLREAALRGTEIVSINPLREPGLVRFAHPQKPGDVLGGGVALAGEFVQVQVGGDVALLQAIALAVLELDDRLGDVLDRRFIERYTTGFDDYVTALRARSVAELSAAAGVAEDQVRRVAKAYAKSRATIACWAMGLTQHKNAVANIQEVVNLLLLRGNLGRPGAGACPVRGHSNVQGDRTVGIHHAPPEAFLAALDREFSIETPRQPGLDTVETIDAMLAGEMAVFVAMGGNFYSAAPDCDAVGRGLESCELTMHVSTKMNRTHLYPGRESLILPCLGRTEVDLQEDGPQFVTVEDSMSMVHRSQGKLAPASAQLRSEPAIVAGLAEALGCAPHIDWSGMVASYDRIREHIEKVVPGFERYNQRVRSLRGFRLPNGARDRDFSRVAGGRARFAVHGVPDLSLPAGRLRMMTMRSHDQYNTTIYGLDDRYRGIRGQRRVVFVHPQDLDERGLADGDPVDIVSEWSDGERRVDDFRAVAFDIPRGNAATYFPEANPLVPLGSRADRSNTPTSKSVIIRLLPRKV